LELFFRGRKFIRSGPVLQNILSQEKKIKKSFEVSLFLFSDLVILAQAKNKKSSSKYDLCEFLFLDEYVSIFDRAPIGTAFTITYSPLRMFGMCGMWNFPLR